MNILKRGSWVIGIAFGCLVSGTLAGTPAPGEEVVFETKGCTYAVGLDGANRRFVDRRTGHNHYPASSPSFFATLNKNGRQYPGAVTSYQTGRLALQFGDSGSTAVIGVEPREDYLTFEVLALSNEEGITGLSLLNLQLDLLGEPAESFAATAVDLNIHTFNSAIPGFNRQLQVYGNPQDGFVGMKCAVIGGPGLALANTLKKVIRDQPQLPQTNLGGPWAAEAPAVRGSYLIEMGRVNETNAAAWIDVAQRIGARQIDLHCGKTLRFGDLEPDRKIYPNGMEGVRRVVAQFHEAGLAVGLHTYAFYLAKESRWVSPVPDARLGKHHLFTLAQALDATNTTVVVEESTRDMSTVTGFLIPNSVTLQVDDELIVFSEIATNSPYGFRKCQRGAWGTKPAAHAKSARVSQLREMFGLFSPDGDSTLFDEIAQRTAEVFNDGGFDMIYLDAIDGAGALAGHHTPSYYQGKFIFELNRHLKKPALMEMSAFDSHFWFARSRMGAWDVPSRSYKMFLNRHAADNQSYAKSFLPRNIGWWAIWDWTPKERIRMFAEDIEYLLGKSLGSGDSLSWIECFSPDSFARSPSQQRFAPLIKQYEDLRLSDYFPPATRARLRELNQDFTLEQTPQGAWQLRPLAFDKHEVRDLVDASQCWRVNNKYDDQPLRLRIEAELSLAAYDDPRGETVEDFGEPSAFNDRQSSSGVSFKLESVSTPVQAGARSGWLQVTPAQAPSASAWMMTTKRLGSAIDFSERGFGLWVHGDGHGEVLNFMWKAPGHVCIGLDEHYVVVDFQGWKYFEFIAPESDRVGQYPWPYYTPTGAPYVETAWVAYDKINSLSIGCINLPKDQSVSCYFSPVRALPHVVTRLAHPSVMLGGNRLVFPVELESGQYLEFQSMQDCKVYGRRGEVVRTLQPQGQVPVLRAGENEICFSTGSNRPVKVRATVTVISHSSEVLGR